MRLGRGPLGARAIVKERVFRLSGNAQAGDPVPRLRRRRRLESCERPEQANVNGRHRMRGDAATEFVASIVTAPSNCGDCRSDSGSRVVDPFAIELYLAIG